MGWVRLEWKNFINWTKKRQIELVRVDTFSPTQTKPNQFISHMGWFGLGWQVQVFFFKKNDKLDLNARIKNEKE